MSNIFVLGSGGFGTALAVMAHKYGQQVTLWSAFQEELDEIRTYGENKKRLPGVAVGIAIELTTDLSAVKDADIAILAVPSFAVRSVSRQLAAYIGPQTVVVNVAKGLEADTLKRFSEVIGEEIPNNPVVVLSGPSHAEEIARGVPTTVVASSQNRSSAEFVQENLGNETLRIYVNDDTVGVELGGALKNIIALCAGICDGMGLGDNAKAALMTRGLAEIGRLGVAMGANSATFAGLAGVGDLIVTCTSMHSRNRRAGILIGQGLTAEEAANRVGMVVEGIDATKAAYHLAKKTGVEMPIVEQLYGIICEGKDIRSTVKNLMGRAQRHEDEAIWLESSGRQAPTGNPRT